MTPLGLELNPSRLSGGPAAISYKGKRSSVFESDAHPLHLCLQSPLAPITGAKNVHQLHIVRNFYVSSAMVAPKVQLA
jgi:hypothetical protein